MGGYSGDEYEYSFTREDVEMFEDVTKSNELGESAGNGAPAAESELAASPSPSRPTPLPSAPSTSDRLAHFERQSKNATEIAGLKPWHEAIVDLQLADPSISQNAIAEHMGVSPAWLSTVMNSDLFREYRRERMSMCQEETHKRIGERLGRIADTALEGIEDKLEEARDEMTLKGYRETADMALKALGFGQKSNGNGAPVNVNLSVSQHTLARAREHMNAQVSEQGNSDGAKEQPTDSGVSENGRTLTIAVGQ